MPVADHAIHPSTQRGPDHRYYCHNQPRDFKGYWAPDGWVKGYQTGSWSQLRIYVENSQSTDCRYDKSLTDQHCEGCKWRGSGEAYDQRIRGEGK